MKVFKEIFEEKLINSISFLGPKNLLRDACEYALTNGGKRYRPLIVLMISEALGNNQDVLNAAISVEFFHTASLIADDLPCMDNDDQRRDKPSLHKAFGETTALLASYALIVAAFERIHIASSESIQNQDTICRIALEEATRCSGILGATGGQFLDIYPPVLNLETIEEVIYKKTVTLFEVSFSFGWIFGGGDLSLLGEVRKASYHFGMAFQTADDLGDLLQDEKGEHQINIACFLGKKDAFIYFENHLACFEKIMEELGIYNQFFREMSDQLFGIAHQFALA